MLTSVTRVTVNGSLSASVSLVSTPGATTFSGLSSSILKASATATGVLLVSSTKIVKTWSAVSDPSVTSKVTPLLPVLACAGVPVRLAVPSPLSTKLSQAGNVGAVMVKVSPSTSLVVMA